MEFLTSTIVQAAIPPLHGMTIVITPTMMLMLGLMSAAAIFGVLNATRRDIPKMNLTERVRGRAAGVALYVASCLLFTVAMVNAGTGSESFALILTVIAFPLAYMGVRRVTRVSEAEALDDFDVDAADASPTPANAGR